MNIIEAIDKEIAHLQHVRSVLTDATPDQSATVKRGRGRPKGSKAVAVKPVKAAKRTMSEEGRARIAAAQRKRHALKKRAAKKAAAEAAQDQTA